MAKRQCSPKEKWGLTVSRRGPPPKSMIKLYHLLRKIPFLPDEEIAKELEIKVNNVKVYKWRLNKKLVTGVTYFDYCPECFSKSLFPDKETGEIVCRRCGYVVDEEYPELKMSKNLTFGTEEKPNTYALTSNLAYGKSLGFTMPKSYLYRIVARVSTNEKESLCSGGENGKNSIPIRQIQTITETVDPLIIRSMLNYGSHLLKKLGFDEDTNRNHILADRYGRLLRKIGAYIMVSKSSLQAYQAARAALAYILSKTDPEKAKEMTEKYPFNSKYMDLVTMLMTT